MATTERRTFSRTTSVEVGIAASPERVWAILTDAAGYPRWTDTIVSLDGQITEGGRLVLRSYLDPKREFKLTVRDMDPPRGFTWGDNLGRRRFSLVPQGEGTRFTMSERIGGPIFPLFAGSIPPFDESFDRFAADLKRRAEAP